MCLYLNKNFTPIPSTATVYNVPYTNHWLAFFPFNKWSYFKNGSELLDISIESDPTNIEMRYIRFLFQSEIPNFLGYHKNLQEDYNLIINNIIKSSLPLKFKQTMLSKMLLVKGITESQTVKIHKITQRI